MKRHAVILVALALMLISNTLNAQISDNTRALNPKGDVCRVALMVPLYLEQVNDEFREETANNKMLLAKPFSFLHFYEGFMVAVDSMVNSRGMKLDMKVYDVDNDVNKAAAAIADPWLAKADIIVGPFYIKPFEKVKTYASQKGIVIVNPITQRSNIIDNQPNVVKVKPSYLSQMEQLEMLMKDYYHANNVFIVSRNGVSDSQMINRINDIAKRCMDSESYVDNKHIVNVIKKHQKRWTYLKVDFDESDFLTDNVHLNVMMLKEDIHDSTSFRNQIVNINYDRDSLHNVKHYASTMRNNLFIVYANDKIFADEIVNKVTKLTEYYPITVIMLPEWGKFDRLFNENLMKMKAIYFDDKYIDYQSIRVMSFIKKFRDKYVTEPQEFAFQGFDIGWYFLNALNEYGGGFVKHLPEYSIPLLHTEFHFKKANENSGYENMFWNVYQFKGYNKVIVKPLEKETKDDGKWSGGYYQMKGGIYYEN